MMQPVTYPENKDSGRGNIVIYQAGNTSPELEVRLEDESLWLSLNQLSDLFGRDKSVLSRHLRNIYESCELDRKTTVAFFATVQKEGRRQIERQIEYFNLDAIISVGYRVNSKQGTRFRIWATGVLRNHIIRGYTANKKRLKELQQSLTIARNILERYDVTSDEAAALLQVVTNYAYALELLDDYDHQRLTPGKGTDKPATGIDYDEALGIISQLKEKFGAPELFGKEKDNSLQGSLAAVMQTFEGHDLYPALEEKAAHLFYFLVKNHSFVDGNKRIAAALFLWFMEKNGLLYTHSGAKKIADTTLVAMTLMIAESNPKEMLMIVTMTINLISQ